MINPSVINPLDLPSVALEQRSHLPSTPCIYFAIDSLGVVQYIGRSINLQQRWSQHHRQRHLESMSAVRIAWLTVDTPELLPGIEAALINWFALPLNGSDLLPSGGMKVGWEIDVPELGQRIRDARHESGRTITQLAAEADISVANWYAIEQERIKVLPLPTLRRIEQVLGIEFGVQP